MIPPELSDDHVVAICGVLADHGVRYLVIGGAAARLHCSGHVTVDIGICPERTEANFVRLAGALNAFGNPAPGRGRTRGRRVPPMPTYSAR